MELNPHKISPSVYMVTVLFVFCLGTAMVFIGIYFPSFFQKSDNYKFTAVAIGVLAPVLLSNTFFCVDVNDEEQNKNSIQYFLTPMYYGSIAAAIILYLSILPGLFFHLSKYWGVGIVLISEFIFGFLRFKNYLRKTKNTKT